MSAEAKIKTNQWVRKLSASGESCGMAVVCRVNDDGTCVVWHQAKTVNWPTAQLEPFVLHRE